MARQAPSRDVCLAGWSGQAELDVADSAATMSSPPERHHRVLAPGGMSPTWWGPQATLSAAVARYLVVQVGVTAVTEPPALPLSRPSAVSARSDDLRASRFPDIRWDGEDTRSRLTELYEWAERFASDTIGWYLDEKAEKSRWSRRLRALAAVFATLGGIVPLTALTVGHPALGNWGFVLLGLAAGCVAYDRYFGYSSAWLRYVSAAMSLRAQLTDFQLSWTREMATLGNRHLSASETYRLIELARAFVAHVNGVVQDETQSWLVEFHTRLIELEAKLQQTTHTSVEGSSPSMDPQIGP